MHGGLASQLPQETKQCKSKEFSAENDEALSMPPYLKHSLPACHNVCMDFATS